MNLRGDVQVDSLSSKSGFRASSIKATPIALIGDDPAVDRLTVPTGTEIFRRGEAVRAIHVVQQGFVELSSGPRNRLRYGPGELFFYEDLVDSVEVHSRDAKALTPLALLRLDRVNFLTLIHRHPTLVLDLLERQHARLREQRIDACHFY